MSNRTQKLHLFLDEKVADPFEIQANANDATFGYASKPLKFNGDVQYKNGAVYTSLLSKFGLVDQSQTTEYNRATSAETLLNGLVVSEGVLARGAELVLRTDLSDEVKRATEIDGLFQSALSAETLARSGADTKLTTDLSFEVGRAGASETLLMSFITGEQTARSNGDTILAGLIDTERTERKASDSAEAKTRADADTALGVLISAEVVDRQNNIVGVSSMLEGYITAEAKSRSDADIALSARVDFLTVNVDAKKMDSLSEIVNRMNATGADVYTRLATIEAVLEQLRGSSIYSGAQAGFTAGVPASL